MKATHKLETSIEANASGGTYRMGWILCRDVERQQEDDGRRYVHNEDWVHVTCKRCLAKKEP